ncbi:MAG: aldo/keto reductase [Candidatus Wildermuthbacteria bacterium]|nr:aldo/keto reductase [Candidatus Wildermuthbacteria bacterium]
MEKIEKKSKLVLGTVQLGMSYGINNTHGKPSEEEAFSILDTALAGGINTFDTAFAYGDEEAVLGRWLRAKSVGGKVRIISKLKPHVLNEYPDGAKGGDIVRSEIEKTLGRLGVEQLDGYLFHSPHYIYLSHAISGMRKAKEEGLVSNIGVSIYDEAEAMQAAEIGVDYIQVPYNIFDQRLDKTNFFEIAKRNHVTIFGRSPFLQGLLLMDMSKIPPYLKHAEKFLSEFIAYSEKAGISRQTLSLLFSFYHPNIDHIVFCVYTVAHLKEDFATIANPPLGAKEAVFGLRERFQDISRGVILPSLWARIKLTK